jgi:hypothetical protein
MIESNTFNIQTDRAVFKSTFDFDRDAAFMFPFTSLRSLHY